MMRKEAAGSCLNVSQRYPYTFAKCCDSKESASLDGKTTSSEGGSVGRCGSKRSEVLLLPKELFPQISTDLEQIEVVVHNLGHELRCDEGRDLLDFSIDFAANNTSRPVNWDKNQSFSEVAFSGRYFLDAHGNAYSRHHFCISSSTSKKSHLVIKACKRRKCSKPNPCIPRCCGDHQSILTLPPTAHQNTKYFRYSCLTPPLNKKPWNPWTSNILRLDNRTRFYQTRYDPHIEGDGRLRNPGKHCNLFIAQQDDGISLALLKDGRLQVTNENTTQVLTVLENFCLDGINGAANGSTTLKGETVGVYVCGHRDLNGTSPAVEIIVSLPACNDVIHPPTHIFQLPPGLFPNMTLNTNDTVLVRFQTGKNGGVLECPEEVAEAALSLEYSPQKYFNENGWLFLRGSIYTESDFCIRGVYHNAFLLRVCQAKGYNSVFPVPWWMWIIKGLNPLASIISILFYVSIAVVYFFRKDKDLVLRCSIINVSISEIITFGLFQSSYYLSNIFSRTITAIIRKLVIFFSLSWMSVLCFDVWLNITFLRPGRKSKKRLWAYVAFTFTFQIAFLGMFIFEQINSYEFLEITMNKKALSGVLIMSPSPLHRSALCLTCINFILFLATVVKLWIARNSSEIKNQKKSFVLYFKLFLLVGLQWVKNFLSHPEYPAQHLLRFTSPILQFLHPIVLFFFLVWDVETKRYLETKHPRVKRAIDFVGAIGYPVRKCWSLRRFCKGTQGEDTNGNGTIEPPHNSNHMYVHTGRVPRTPK